MNRFASPIVKIAFEGPDVQEETLYQIFRVRENTSCSLLSSYSCFQPYGQIQDINNPTPVPAGSFRSSVITFRRLRSATIARNVMHRLKLPSTGTASTLLRTAYEMPIEAHAIRDWMSGHPKIVLPVLVFLLGTLTYTVGFPLGCSDHQPTVHRYLTPSVQSWYKPRYLIGSIIKVWRISIVSSCCPLTHTRICHLQMVPRQHRVVPRSLCGSERSFS
jgi:hypothetical protein